MGVKMPVIHSQSFLRLAGVVRGPKDLSSRKGFSPVKGIADTGFLVAFANRFDRPHDWALRSSQRITEPLLTCEPVLAEAAFHLESTALVLSMVTEGLVELAFNCVDHLPRLETLAHRYADRQPDLADL